MQKTINSTIFRKMIIASAKILDDNKNFVDSLNVFPVPDGDTGTNMSLTYNNVVKELNNCLENDFASITRAIVTGALRGARGNSGVILSQIFIWNPPTCWFHYSFFEPQMPPTMVYNYATRVYKSISLQ